MRVDDAQGVVDVAEGPHPAQVVEREVDDRRGNHADRDRAPAVDVAGRRGDRHETGDHPVDAADQARLAPGRVVPCDPDQEGDRRADVRVEDRSPGDCVGEVGIAAVEPVPAEPEQTGPDRDHRQVVRRVDLAVALEPGPYDGRRNEARDARGEMDHVSAGEVEGALLGEVAAAPDQEGVDRVDERRPEDHERDPGLEVDPAQNRAEHQDRRDRGEDDLEVGQRRLREDHFPEIPEVGDVPLADQRATAEDRARLAPHVGEEIATARSEDVHRMPEAQLEAVEHPDHQHQRERDEGEHHRVHRPAFLHHTAIENGKAGHAHQADQGRRGELPSIVAWTQPIHRSGVPFRLRAPPDAPRFPCGIDSPCGIDRHPAVSPMRPPRTAV